MADLLNMKLKVALLRKQACFHKLTENEVEKLALLLNEQYIKAGQTVVNEGEFVDSVFFIVKGTADVRQVTVKENELETHSIATLKEGDSIGLNETGFYSLSGRRTATVVAITDMDLLCLSIAEFHGFALTYSHVNEVMRENADDVLRGA